MPRRRSAVRRYRDAVPVDVPAELIEPLPPQEAWQPHTSDALSTSWFAGDARVVRLGPLDTAGPPRATRSATDAAGRVWFVEPRPSGERADRPDLHPRPDALAHHVGVTLRRWHDETDPSLECDALAGLRGHLAARVDEIDVAILPEPYDRHDAARLVDLVDEGLDERLVGRQLVPVHGAPTLARFLAGPGGSTVLVDGPIGLGDPHLDLAVAHRSVHTVLGPGAVFEFYDGYGMDPDLVLLDRFTLAALLA